jgi:phospholipid/cholesterol/gamma-HCH transport system substrate-binding protein
MKKSRMQQNAVEAMVGAFLFMALLALGFFTIVLSQENWFSKSYQLEVSFDDVTGLIKGDKVYVHGVDVGRVKDLTITAEGVKTLITLEQDIKLRDNYMIRVLPASVLGGKYVSIDEGGIDNPLLAPGTEVRGHGPVDFIAQLTEATQAIRGSLEKGGILANLEGTMANLREITDRLQRGEGTIGRLLTEDSLYNELRKISSNIGEVAERVNKGEGSLGKLLSKDDALYRDLSDTVKALKDVAETLSRGEGTLGKLAKDDTMYRQVNELLGEARAAIDDLRETTPVVSFSSIFFGAF